MMHRYRPGRAITALTMALAVLLLAEATTAFPPRQPIPLPLYTFDLESPTVQSPSGELVAADAVLRKGQQGEPVPVTQFPGENLGLGRPMDDLDAFSFNRAATAANTEWVFLFSVTRATTGDVPPDASLDAVNVPYNVADQAERGHAAGDGFISLINYDTNGPVTALLRGPFGTTNNAQTINNYDEGGQDLQGEPPTSSSTYTPMAAEDEVDGMSEEPRANESRGALRQAPGIFFSVTPDSPSLVAGFLPGDSGADIFHDPAPDQIGLQQTFPFAFAQQLGLVILDDIDALAVNDANSNGVFDANDSVWFSLAPGSPSLMFFPDASPNATADIFVSRIGAGGMPMVEVFAHAADLGLAGAADDIDALDLLPCGTPDQPCQPLAFGAASGIRLFPGDWNNDGIVDSVDVPDFVWCLSGPREGVDFIPPTPLCRDIFDLNADMDVDLADFARFTEIFGSGPPAN